MGETGALLWEGAKELMVFSAFGQVTPEMLTSLGLDPTAEVYMGHLDDVGGPKEPGETRKVYAKLKEYLQAKADSKKITVVYRFQTDNEKLILFAESPAFAEVFGDWDARSQDSEDAERKFFYKQFKPRT